MRRILIPVLAAVIGAPCAFAEGVPQQIPIQITPPKANVTIRTVTLDATGAVTAEGQKVLDEMVEEGWRAVGITTVSAGNPTTVALMFSRVVRPPAPSQPAPQGQPQGNQPQAPTARPAPLPAPAPPATHEHNP
jgi:hypothetical protein